MDDPKLVSKRDGQFLRGMYGSVLLLEDYYAYRKDLMSLATYERKGRLPKGTPRIEYAWREGGGYMALPRGLYQEVCRRTGMSTPQNVTVSFPPQNFGFHRPLREEQKQPALTIARSGGGVLVGATGTGKTIVAMALVASFGQPTLWLTHRKSLARLALKTARACFNLPPSAYGLVGSGVRDDIGTHFTVGMLASFAGFSESTWRKHRYAERFGTIVVDEVHHIPARTYSQVITRFSAAHRIGLSATPDRTDGLGPLMVAMFGPTVAKIDTSDAIRLGHIILPKIYRVPTALQFHDDPEQMYRYWADVQHIQATDPERNLLLCRLIAHLREERRRIMVMVTLRKHANTLSQMLRGFGVPAVVVDGSTNLRERDKLATACVKGEAVLIGTDVLYEGVDLPLVDRLILATPTKGIAYKEGDRTVLHPRLQQQMGRIARAAKGKSDAIVYDVYDPEVRTLRRQANQRRVAYRMLGLEVKRLIVR